MSDLICRNVRVSGRRTSIKLEADMWEALYEICDRSGRSLYDICTQVHGQRGSANFTSAMRLFILDYYRAGRERRHSGSPAPQREESANGACA